jgi:hypothetical protein
MHSFSNSHNLPINIPHWNPGQRPRYRRTDATSHSPVARRGLHHPTLQWSCGPPLILSSPLRSLHMKVQKVRLNWTFCSVNMDIHNGAELNKESSVATRTSRHEACSDPVRSASHLRTNALLIEKAIATARITAAGLLLTCIIYSARRSSRSCPSLRFSRGRNIV